MTILSSKLVSLWVNICFYQWKTLAEKSCGYARCVCVCVCGGGGGGKIWVGTIRSSLLLKISVL